MRLVATLSEPKCTICKSGRREQADHYLALLGERDEDRDRVWTWEVLTTEVLPLLLGVPSLSVSSAKRHRQNHCRKVLGPADAVVEPGSAEPEVSVEAGLLLEQIDSMLESPLISPFAVNDLQLRAYLIRFRGQLARGEEIQPLTHDGAGRAADRQMQAQKSGQEATLLEMLGKGLDMALKGKIPSAEDAKELEAGGDVIEGEVVREQDGEVVES